MRQPWWQKIIGRNAKIIITVAVIDEQKKETKGEEEEEKEETDEVNVSWFLKHIFAELSPSNFRWNHFKIQRRKDFIFEY